MTDHPQHEDWNLHIRRARGAGERFLDYLRGRPAESWLFFAAGFLLATFLT